MKANTIVIALVGVAMVFGSVLPSYADHKTYAAAECVRWNENADPATYISSSRRFNPSATRRLRLDCPVVKDRLGDIVGSWIRVIDRHPGDRVCARIAAFRHLGSRVISHSGQERCTGIAWNSPNSVQLFTGALGSIVNDMHYYFSVNPVPNRSSSGDSGVVTYFVNEFNGFD